MPWNTSELLIGTAWCSWSNEVETQLLAGIRGSRKENSIPLLKHDTYILSSITKVHVHIFSQ